MQIWVASKNSRILHHRCPRIIHNVSAGLQIFGKISLAAKAHNYICLCLITHTSLSLFSSSVVQEVDLGFTPKKYNTDSLGFSFWSYAAPDGRCLTYAESKKSGFLFSGGGGDVYTNSFISNDTSWTISRILAVVGSVFGSFALVCVKNKSIASSLIFS